MAATMAGSNPFSRAWRGVIASVGFARSSSMSFPVAMTWAAGTVHFSRDSPCSRRQPGVDLPCRARDSSCSARPSRRALSRPAARSSMRSSRPAWPASITSGTMCLASSMAANPSAWSFGHAWRARQSRHSGPTLARGLAPSASCTALLLMLIAARRAIRLVVQRRIGPSRWNDRGCTMLTTMSTPGVMSLMPSVVPAM